MKENLIQANKMATSKRYKEYMDQIVEIISIKDISCFFFEKNKNEKQDLRTLGELPAKSNKIRGVYRRSIDESYQNESGLTWLSSNWQAV